MNECEPEEAVPESLEWDSFYQQALSEKEVADLARYREDSGLLEEIDCARVALRRALEYLGRAGAEIGPRDFERILGRALEAMRTIGRLHRDRHALGDGLDEIGMSKEENEMYDQLSLELGIDM